MATFEECLASGNFSGVAPALDEFELQSHNPEALLDWPHALHILAHVYNFDLEDARFVWKRLSDAVKQTAAAKAALVVLQSAWNKDYEGFWRSLHSYQWDPMTSRLAAALEEKMRLHVTDLLSRAYSNIHIDKMAGLLGVPSANALQISQGLGWEQTAGGMMKVHQKEDSSEELTDIQHLQRLAEYAIHMESS